MSRPVATDASVTTSQEGWSTQGRPMPDRCEPCPGKVNANIAASVARTPTGGLVTARYAVGAGTVVPMRVAAVQTATSLDPVENRRLVLDRVGAAAGDGAALVVFPEGTMCTFGPGSFDLSQVAEDLDGPFVDAVCSAAARHGVVVVAGMFERSSEPGRVHNTVVAVGPDGLLGAYRKVHLFDALGAKESLRVVPGDPGDLLVFPAGDLVVGVMTCYDLCFPELLVLPTHWYAGPGKAEVFDVLVRASAIESTAYMVAAGKPGPECVGRSTVVDPAGQVLDLLGDGTAVAELSAARVAEVRAALPVLEHRRFGVRPTGRARSGTRTRTPLRAKAFEASASTDSAIRAGAPSLPSPR